MPKKTAKLSWKDVFDGSKIRWIGARQGAVLAATKAGYTYLAWMDRIYELVGPMMLSHGKVAEINCIDTGKTVADVV